MKQKPLMTKPWDEIARSYEECSGNDPAVVAMRALVKQIRESHYVDGIYAWTSHLDLCIVQCEVEYPFDGPYLRISPQSGGHIEFRYIDTYIKEKQWVRIVAYDGAFDRLQRFFTQLHWFTEVRK